MITLAVNNNNDIFITANKDLAVNEGLQAVQAVCQNAVLTLQEEINLDVYKGIPYFDIVFGAHPDLELFRQYLHQILSGVDNVQRVQNLEITVANGVLQYSAVIVTDFGETTING